MKTDRIFGCSAVFAIAAVWLIGHFAGQDLAESGAAYSGSGDPAELSRPQAGGGAAEVSELQKLRADTQKYVTEISVRYIAALMTAFAALFVHGAILHLQINELKERLRGCEDTMRSGGTQIPEPM